MTNLCIRLCLTAFLLAPIASQIARASDDGKCTIATQGETATARACAKGGRAEAKKVMKEMVKVAKARGQKFSCDGCHKDLDTYELTKNATEDFKKLAAASSTK